MLTTKKKTQIGYVFVICAAALGGLADVLPKPILDHISMMDPLSMTGLMFIINGVFFTIAIRTYGKINPRTVTPYRAFLTDKKKSLFFLLFAGLAEVSATAVFYFGLRETSAANSAILGNADILFTWVLAFVIFRENIKRREGLPVGLIIIGSILLPIVGDFVTYGVGLTSFVTGDLFVVFSGLFYGIEMILLKYVSDKINAARTLEIISYVGGSAALLIAVLIGSPMGLNLEHLGVLLITAIFGIGISVWLMIISISYIGAVRTILIFSTTTIFGILFSALILSEKINFSHGLAFVFVFVGIYMLRNKLAED